MTSVKNTKSKFMFLIGHLFQAKMTILELIDQNVVNECFNMSQWQLSQTSKWYHSQLYDIFEIPG